MSKQDKLLQKIRNNPTNVKFETIQKIMLTYGFTETTPSGGSSHYRQPLKTPCQKTQKVV